MHLAAVTPRASVVGLRDQEERRLFVESAGRGLLQTA
jgi:hypothetical protein